jgi:hypothetical protein
MLQPEVVREPREPVVRARERDDPLLHRPLHVAHDGQAAADHLIGAVHRDHVVRLRAAEMRREVRGRLERRPGADDQTLAADRQLVAERAAPRPPASACRRRRP